VCHPPQTWAALALAIGLSGCNRDDSGQSPFLAEGTDGSVEPGPTVTSGRMTVTEIEGRPAHGSLDYTFDQAISWRDDAYDGRLFLAITGGLGELTCAPWSWQYVSEPGQSALIVNIGPGAEATYSTLAYAYDLGSGPQSNISAVGDTLEPDGSALPDDIAAGDAFSTSVQGYLATYATTNADLSAGDFAADVVGTHCGTLNTFTQSR
jgi:hypothetical protein